MKNKLFYIPLTLIIFMVGSCTFFDLELTKDPNELAPENANPDYVLNQMQIDFKDFLNNPDPSNWNGVNKFGMEATRMINVWGGTYENAYTPTEFDAVWTLAYEGLLMDAHTFIPVYEANEWYLHSGIAKVLQAYVLATLVDFFGDVPFAESFDASNLNPVADNQSTIYNLAITYLDEAIADLQKESKAVPSNDLFYNGDASKWITLANTLKLKLYLNLRLIDKTNSTNQINALIALNNVIDEPDEEFLFRYSTTEVNPDSRNPHFIYNYLNGANDYMSNYFMWTLYGEKNNIDPRIRYYFYRQTLTSSTNFQELPCYGTTAPNHYSPEMPYCTLSDGYWGRDHLDDDGIPPDTRRRTLYGIYPAGGNFDNNNGISGNSGDGLQGAGIEVIMTQSFVKFMLAEASLTLGTTGDTKTWLMEAVQNSIETVMDFGSAQADPLYIPTNAMITAYLDEVSTLYDNATNEQERLEVITKEYYIALFGNGVEAYNLVRRTTFPSNLQPALLEAAGNFCRSFIYPAICVNLNSSIHQKTTFATQVFWDTNAAGIIQ
ncbi:MAG TPA: SusD/RagB family nutrient-binding outer membrane lipoprotein [Marinilabiliales bacterium]|nr:SusD/RagB family nutrient-binding outer membrane lipoprotein [Marinilabiliales bacterium]